MLHNGPIPYAVHGLLDYVIGAVLIAAPFLFAFSDTGTATAIAIGCGVLVLLSAASTDGPTSLVNAVPIPAHVLLDVVLGVWFVAAPFVAGFSDRTTPTAFFVGFGVLELLAVVSTRFPRTERRLAP